MTVLEIHRNFAWWFEAPDENVLWKLRESALLPDNHLRLAALQQQKPACAYQLNGDPATFNLPIATFDRIIIRSDHSPLRKCALERRVRPWLTPGGYLSYEFGPMLRPPVPHAHAHAHLLLAVQPHLVEPALGLERTTQIIEPVLRSLL